MQSIFVNPSVIIAENRADAVGINLNYLRDADANRAGRPLHEAITDMGAKWLRYPGGGKSDCHMFAKPPYERCEPVTFGFYSNERQGFEVMDFDMFMEVVKKTGAQPHVTVGGPRMVEKTDTPIDVCIEHAAAWVRYANIKKGYGVKHWEIGNENWSSEKYTAEEIGYIVRDFSKAMKSVDPSIKICASGYYLPDIEGIEYMIANAGVTIIKDWYQKFLPIAGPYIDILSVSEYTSSGWGSYDYYIQNENPPLLSQASMALDAIDKYIPERADSVKVVLSELNSKDFTPGGWPSFNNLGHSLVTFDALGQILTNPRIRYGMLWNTRWMSQKEQHNELWYGLDENNELLPAGMAVKLWGKFARDTFIEAIDDGNLKVYACKDENGVSVFIINKHPIEAVREIKLNHTSPNITSLYSYSGSSPDDLFPVLSESDTMKVVCKPYSVTIAILS